MASGTQVWNRATGGQLNDPYKASSGGSSSSGFPIPLGWVGDVKNALSGAAKVGGNALNQAIAASNKRTQGSGGGGGSKGGGGSSAAAQQKAKEDAERNAVRAEATARVQEILSAYDGLFGGLDTLLRDRAKTVETDYGEQFGTAAKQYADSLPMIESSYASLGAADSTDLRDADIKAEDGFKETNKTIKKNKEADLSKIGQYGSEQKAKWNADRDSVNRLNGRLAGVEDLGELRSSRNSLEEKLGSVRADSGTLNTDSGARGQLSGLTQDAGRFDSLTNALDAILKSSMGRGVKEAAVQSVADSGGLSETDKKKTQTMLGNTYAEQAAL